MSVTSTQGRKGVLRREIAERDLSGVADLLTRGFPSHPRSFWVGVLRQLSAHPTPAHLPRYGYLLEHDRVPVGVVLTISTRLTIRGSTFVRCNLSSWYVEPDFRVYSAFLTPRGQLWNDVTFLNVTPARHTLAIIEAQGFVPYSSGQFVVTPSLRGLYSRVHIRPFHRDVSDDGELPLSEAELLAAHARHGCLAVICHDRDGSEPFVFAKWRRIHAIPSAFLVYCRDIEAFARFSGPLGRYLALRGFPLLVLDASTPPPSLCGKFIDYRQKYYKGANCPRIGDLAFTERALFGF